jgi:hypothetical protein
MLNIAPAQFAVKKQVENPEPILVGQTFEVGSQSLHRTPIPDGIAGMLFGKPRFQ